MDGEQLRQAREAKGLTQKELAEKTNLNTRTIQRLENGETQARAFTVNQIADVLGIHKQKLQNKEDDSLWIKVINAIGILLLNLGIVVTFGYLVVDSNANFNSLVGALILSIFMPITIYFYTKHMKKEERLLKFSWGLWLYALLVTISHGYRVIFGHGLIYVVLLFSVTIYLVAKFDRSENK